MSSSDKKGPRTQTAIGRAPGPPGHPQMRYPPGAGRTEVQKYTLPHHTLSVNLFVSNKRQTAKQIGPNFFVVTHITPGKVYE